MEWQSKYTGYTKEEADAWKEAVEKDGGVAWIDRREEMEMGSGPHFQGYYVHFIEGKDVKKHVDSRTFPSRDELPPEDEADELHLKILGIREAAKKHLEILASQT